ncbi:MAG: hypothetical protein JWN86_581 [Planctomycetota bacterium]|nr:hypothetical protein [Planctomycetota bacterium]
MKLHDPSLLLRPHLKARAGQYPSKRIFCRLVRWQWDSRRLTVGIDVSIWRSVEAALVECQETLDIYHATEHIAATGQE